MSAADSPHGLLLLYKPGGITSHDLVAQVRRALNTRKVGHAGTLDPMATGLMLVGVGDATRLLTYLVGEDKLYDATVRFGVSTSTEDAQGEVTAVADQARVRALTYDDLGAALATQRGTFAQVPSAVSAIKVDGKRSYQRVREGEDVQLAPRPVTVYELELRESRTQELEDGTTVVDVGLRVRCSSGTYVRAIARDLGAYLGVGAHLVALKRIEVGPFNLDDATTVQEPNLAAHLIPPAEVATARFPSILLDSQQAQALRNGRSILAPAEIAETTGPIAALASPSALIGLIEVHDGRTRILMNLPQRGAK